jgi:hypothetical protein
MNVNSYAMAFKHEVCKGRRGSVAEEERAGSGQAYSLLLARWASGCFALNETLIVGVK